MYCPSPERELRMDDRTVAGKEKRRRKMKEKPDKEAAAIRLLQEKAAALGRLPKKQDFEAATISWIKSSLGPWPRALEKAGLKPVSQTYLNRKARQRAKRRKNRGKKEALGA